MTNERAVMEPLERPRDEVGAETLERLGDATSFNSWMFSRLEPWLGDSVVEIGAGLGNLSQFIADRERVLLTDVDDAYLRKLETRFAAAANVECRKLELPLVATEHDYGRYDSAVCLNVLEHIEEDVAALTGIRSLLRDDGRLILLVPAFGWLYGTLDVALGHFRRYNKRSLESAIVSAGLKVIHMEYFNMAAMPGWWFTGRVLKHRLIPIGSLKLYQALVPLFRLERFLPWRVGQSLIAVAEIET